MTQNSLPIMARIAVYDESTAGFRFTYMDNKPAPTIRDLYPNLNYEQLAEVEDTWERYLALVLRIFERLESQSDSPAIRLTQTTDAVPFDSQEVKTSLS
jgi:hypothetical protein